MTLYPQRTLRLARFWFDELETAADMMSLEDARQALAHLQAGLAEVDQFLNGSKVVQR
jgi:hypothetical protein